MRLLEHLSPSVFLAVMAPAVLSVSAESHGRDTLAQALLWLATALLAATLLAWLVRAATAPAAVRAALTSPVSSFGAFTLVAALALLGDAFSLQDDAVTTLGLWTAGALAWALLVYGIALNLILFRAGSIAGWVVPAWAYPVVGTQTLVATATALSGRWWPSFFLFVGLTGFLIAWGLYLVVGSWIGQRLVFDRVDAELLEPQHWIPMSALATSGLAATRLVSSADRYALVADVLPVLEAFAVTAWAGCTAWLVLILGLEAWRIRRLGVGGLLVPGIAGVAYALGIYSAASWELWHVYGVPVETYSTVLFWIAVAALVWAAVATLWWARR